MRWVELRLALQLLPLACSLLLSLSNTINAFDFVQPRQRASKLNILNRQLARSEQAQRYRSRTKGTAAPVEWVRAHPSLLSKFEVDTAAAAPSSLDLDLFTRSLQLILQVSSRTTGREGERK